MSEKIKNVQKELEKVQEHLQKAQTRSQTLRTLEEAETKYKKVKIQEKELSAILKFQEKKQTERDGLEAAIAHIQEEVLVYQKLEEKKKKLIERKTFLEKQEKKLLNQKLEIEKLQEHLQEDKTEEKMLDVYKRQLYSRKPCNIRLAVVSYIVCHTFRKHPVLRNPCLEKVVY